MIFLIVIAIFIFAGLFAAGNIFLGVYLGDKLDFPYEPITLALIILETAAAAQIAFSVIN